jgi:wyosine [tRNA(Phe)-imidazoG37] synthetase (radical SAM superfamily)
MNCVFGPVPSRRLGRSLGVDLVPFKTCTYDCIYCQLGRTTDKTIQRKEWVHWEVVLDEIKRKLDSRPDYITFSGSGEPTLHARLGELIERIKAIAGVPVAVLTNGSLLWRADVRQDLQLADLVVPSLDAGDDALFRSVNRPHEAISFAQLVEGLVAFRQEYHGQYWLEVFLLAGSTSIDPQVRKIAAIAREIRPDRVQLNTVTRPPAESFAQAVPRDQLAELASLFQPRAEVIADYARELPNESMADREDILEMIRRRPCSAQDIVAARGLHINEVLKYLDALTHQGRVEQVASREAVYYRAVRSAGDV